MSVFRDVIARLAQSLAGPQTNVLDADRGAEPVEIEPGSPEFNDLLESIGAEAGTDDPIGAALALKDAQIAELTENLAKMRSVADSLAETERARLAAEARVAELEQLVAGDGELTPGELLSVHSLERKVERLEKSLAKEQASSAKLRDRLSSTRERADERHRVAAERWHELRRIGRERRTLEDQLKAREKLLDEVEGLLPSISPPTEHESRAAFSRLFDLMGDRPTADQAEQRPEGSTDAPADGSNDDSSDGPADDPQA